MADAGVRLVLTQASLLDACRSYAKPDARFVDVVTVCEEAAEKISQLWTTRRRQECQMTWRRYVLYTSGSTGRPKGQGRLHLGGSSRRRTRPTTNLVLSESELLGGGGAQSRDTWRSMNYSFINITAPGA